MPRETRFRQLIQQKHWTVYETFSVRFQRGAKELAKLDNDPQLASLPVSRSSFDRWMRGDIKRLPWPATSRVLEHLLGEPATKLFGPPDNSNAQAPEDHTPTSTQEPAVPLWVPSDPSAVTADDLHRLLHSAADRSRLLATAAEASDLAPSTPEQLQEQITHLARAYVHSEPLPLFLRMVQLRDHIASALQIRQRLDETRELHFLLGQLCALLSNASLDMGDIPAAITQAKASQAFARSIKHPGLLAFATGLQAMIAYWDDRPSDAADLACTAQSHAPHGAATTRLLTIEALARARLHQKTAATHALMKAEAARETSTLEELHDHVRGEFGFSPAKGAYLAASAYIHLGMADQAEQQALAALELYAAGPPADRSYGNQAIAGIDLATARIIRGQLDGAYDAVTTVTALPTSLRIDGLNRRLNGITRLLSTPRFSKSAETAALTEHIETFTAQTIRPPTSTP